MTKEEKEARMEWRRKASRIKRAYNRLAKAKPSKEAFLKEGTMAGMIGEPVYEISAEDYQTLEPLFSAELKQTITIGGTEIEIVGPVFPVQHITYGDRHFITMVTEDEAEKMYLAERLREIITFI